MFFLLRAAFWLSLVILFIPADPGTTKSNEAQKSVSTFEAVGAAHSTYEDLKGFCTRNPATCDTGRVAVDSFSAKARTGARWVYEQLDQRDSAPTGSTPPPAAPSAAASNRPMILIDGPLPQPRPLT